MPKQKPTPGHCGICGRAVVRPDPTVIDAKFNSKFGRTDINWISGHLYEADDIRGGYRLVRVRCQNHMPYDDLARNID
jgi:hypothetical protein